MHQPPFIHYHPLTPIKRRNIDVFMNAAGRLRHVVLTGKTVPRRRVAFTGPFFTSSSVGAFFSTQSFGTTFARRTPSRAIDVAGTGLGIQRTALLALGRTVSTASVAL